MTIDPTGTAPGQSSLEVTGPSAVIIALTVGAFIWVLGFWTYLEHVAQWEPGLWYLNWPPGAYSVYAFGTSAYAKMMLVMMLSVGAGATLTKGTPLPVIAAAMGATLIFATQNDGSAREIAQDAGVARVECHAPGTR